MLQPKAWAYSDDIITQEAFYHLGKTEGERAYFAIDTDISGGTLTLENSTFDRVSQVAQNQDNCEILASYNVGFMAGAQLAEAKK